MIERVTGYRFEKDGLHTVYKIEKTRGAGASRVVRRSPSVEDMPQSSRSRPRKEKKIEKFGKWIKAIFTTCTYAARTAHQDRLENHEANPEAREHVGLPPLSLVQSPPRFDDLPSLSKTDSEEEEQEQLELDPHTSLRSTLQSMRRSTKCEHHTLTTHRQGRAVVSSSSSSSGDDDDGGGEEDVAGASGAAGGDDVDWDTIQEDEE